MEVCVRVRVLLPLFFSFFLFLVFVELAGQGIWDNGFKVFNY